MQNMTYRRASELITDALPAGKNADGLSFEAFCAQAPSRVDGEPWARASLVVAWRLGIPLWLPGIPDTRDEPDVSPAPAQAVLDTLLRWRVPARVADVVANGLISTPAVKSIRRWRERAFFTLCGPAGVGKSVAAGVGLQLGPLGPCPFTTPQGPDGECYWPHAPAWTRAAFVGRGFDALPVEIRRASVLVIDDLGDEIDNTHARSRISELITERDDLSARTIITTNMGKDDIARRYGWRMAERLTKHGWIVPVRGESLRGSHD